MVETNTTEQIATVSNFSINKEGWKKVGKGGLIALGGALLTFLEAGVIFQNIDFGSWTVLLVAANSTVINLLKVWIGKYQVLKK